MVRGGNGAGREMTDEIADRILADSHARLAHPGADQLICAAHRSRTKGERQASGLFTNLAERLNPLHHRCCWISHVAGGGQGPSIQSSGFLRVGSFLGFGAWELEFL